MIEEEGRPASEDVINPFRDTMHISVSDKLRICTIGLILLPLRAAAMGILFLLAGLVGFICNLGVPIEDEPKPHQGYRKMCQTVIHKLTRICAFVMGFHRMKTKGKLASCEEAPVIIIAPHYNFVDGLFSTAIADMTYISRKENDTAPILGHAVRCLQPIYVTRGKRSARNETVKEIHRRAQGKGSWPYIGVYPEGTITNGKCLITFKQGAFSAGLPVQPVIFKYPKYICSWTWIAPSTLQQLAYMLTRFSNDFEYEILPVYKPNEEERNDAILYANNVRAVMAKALGVPTSDHSFEDCCLMQEAESKNLPVEAGLIEYSKVNRELGLNLDALKELLGEFASIDTNKDGLITFDEFSQQLDGVSTETARSMFYKIDKDRRGYIDFKSFVYAVSREQLHLAKEDKS